MQEKLVLQGGGGGARGLTYFIICIEITIGTINLVLSTYPTSLSSKSNKAIAN